MHIPVMLSECINGLNIKPGGFYVDGTLGGAGHSLEIVRYLKNGRFLGIDQDADAIARAEEIFSRHQNSEGSVKISLAHENFSAIKKLLGTQKVDGVLLDLGVSSFQLDEAQRGFSYIKDNRLDMRMNRSQSFSAYDIVNTYPKAELSRIIFQYGEERFANRIADRIIEARGSAPIETTLQLVEIIERSIPRSTIQPGSHPAKRTFQALRIAVNDELSILEQAVKDMVDVLNPGGRLCVITFHSLEDRIVKTTLRTLEKPCTCPTDLPYCVCGKLPSVRLITRKPIAPSESEQEQNPRSRSAKLRVAEKV